MYHRRVASAAVAFRFALAIVFLLAGLAKLPRRREFTEAVLGYGLVPARIGRVVGAWLPAVELGAAVLLIAGLGTEVVAGLIGVLLTGFSIAIVANLVRGREIDCGCYGVVAERRITWLTVARNAVLIALAAVVAIVAPTALSVDELLRAADRSTVGDSAAFGLFMAASAGVLVASVAQEAIRLLRLATAFESRGGGST
jgi:uncharacterized membrane protein YphA (DoxX/SURF4 family)